MEPYPLTTLLAMRRREEEAAEASWAAALAALRAAEARLGVLGAAVDAARGRLDEAAAGGRAPDAAALLAGDALARERFLARRRDEWTRAAAAQTAFRDGPLAAARTAEAGAREAHADKHRAREAVEKHQEQFLAESRRQAERRAEDTRDDVASSNRHRRTHEP